MKIIHPVLLAAVLFSPFSSAAQTPRPDQSSTIDKNREQIQTDITEVRRELDTLRANATGTGRDKLDALSARIDKVEGRAVAVTDEHDFDENKHKFKNALKKIRRELTDSRENLTVTPDALQATPTNP